MKNTILKSFRVKNFKQFKELFLDFSNVRDYSYSEDCLSADRKFIKSLLVYGPNASGKSNLGYAIFDVMHHLADVSTDSLAYQYYLRADSIKNYADFEYTFNIHGQYVEYIYSKKDYKTLIKEKLIINKKCVFEWDLINGTLAFDGIKDFGFESLNTQIQIGSISFLRYMVNNSPRLKYNLIFELMDFILGMLWFRRTDNGNSFIGTLSNTHIDEYIIKHGLVEELEKFLNQNEVNEKLSVMQLPDGSEKIYFKHKQLLPMFITASSGTLALSIFFYWMQFKNKSSFVFIDEFDAFYHFSVADNILKYLRKLPIQSIVTTHNTNLLKTKYVRPDCCFLLDGSAQLKSLADRTQREIRQGNNLEKLYIYGEFND